MTNPLVDLTIVDWAQIFAAIGQCLSAFGALLAARYALQTVQEMKRQSESDHAKFQIEVDEFIATNGPVIQVRWEDNHQNAPTNCLQLFPTNPKALLVMQESKPNKTAFEAFALWWNEPAPNPVPSKFIVLNIFNAQIKSSGTAQTIKGTIGTEIKKRKPGFPTHQVFDLTFEIDKCDPQEMIKIPICVEGMPAYHFSIKRIEYKSRHSDQPLSFFTGERDCIYESNPS